MDRDLFAVLDTLDQHLVLYTVAEGKVMRLDAYLTQDQALRAG